MGVVAIFLGGLHKTIGVGLLLLCLVTADTTTGIGRRDAEKAIFVTRSSPIVRAIGVVLPLPYARDLPDAGDALSFLSLLGDLSPRPLLGDLGMLVSPRDWSLRGSLVDSRWL